MSEKETEMTVPVTKEESKRPRNKFFERRSSWLVMGILFVFLMVLLGILLGIPRGINDRLAVAESQAAPKVHSQLESAKQDIEEGRYEVALGRLDWILEEMSSFLSDEELAEVGELYSQVLLEMSSVGTPTPQPSPTATIPVYTPTPDLRGVEELFNTAQGQIADKLWDEGIQTLEALRHKNLEYRAVEVDGMLYIALRNRGVQKILVEGSLEPGIYDLTLAERFAPLDSTAEGFRTWTRLYLTGASYWGVDWAQVLYYFGQVYPMLPNLRDGTNMTATERYRIGAIEYGSQLVEAEEYCEAQEYFDLAMELGSDPEVQPTAQWVADECWEQQNPPTPTPENTPTPKPTRKQETQAPTEEPTPTPTGELTEEPSEEPNPQPTDGTQQQP